MGVLERGSIVLISIPYSDLSDTELRPAFIVTKSQGLDVVCCQITSAKPKDNCFVPIVSDDLVSGVLKNDSYVRANKIYTLHQKLVVSNIGKLNDSKIDEIMETIFRCMGK